MENFVYKVLGDDRIREICKSHELDDNEIKIVKEIFDGWEDMLFQPEKKMAFAFEKMKGSKNIRNITHACMAISLEFLKRNKTRGAGNC